MSMAHSALAKDIFQRVVELAPAEHAAFLEGACAGDRVLRAEVDELLRCESRAPLSFLAGSEKLVAEPLVPGQRLGPYEILATLGEGGMGTVYEAEQRSPRRRVALKVIRPGRMTADAAQRLQREAEALGHLSHPGIAQIFEAGTATTEQGRELPYLAMERVDGLPLLTYAEAQGLSASDRLELLARVAEAVHHAHLRGVIHRDLKSENVLVQEEEAGAGGAAEARVGQPKILDFGIAQWVGAPADPGSRQTRLGDIVGTLSSMSPEQVGGDAHTVDVRTDVYAMGVMLYELLAGRPPIDLGGCALPEAARRIAEELPPLLGTFDRSYQGDLEVIAAQALHKQPERRYQSAADLAADIRRSLRGEAIAARADSGLYVISKALARHRWKVGAGALFLVLLGAFAVVSSIQARRNERLARKEAAARQAVEAQLTAGNIERGRLFGKMHNPLGEELIWREYLRAPDSLHAYWALWEFYANNPCRATRDIHDEEISDLVLARDESWVATSSLDGRIILSDASNLEQIAVLPGNEPVEALSLSPDGRGLAAALAQGDIVLWDLPSRSIAATLHGAQGMVWDIDHHPGGSLLAAACDDGAARLFDLDEGTVRSLPGWPGGPVHGVCFSRDGALLAATGVGVVCVWSDLGAAPRLLATDASLSYSALTIAAGGRQVFAGARDRRIHQWDVETGKELATLEPKSGSVRGLWVADDGETLYSRGWWRVDAWSLPDLLRRSSLELPEMGYGTAGTADGSRIVESGVATVRVWDLKPDAGRTLLGGHQGRVTTALSADGALVASGDSSGTVRLWEAESGRFLRSFSGHTGRVRGLAFHPGGGLLASGSSDGTLRLQDLSSGELRWVVSGYDDSTSQSLAFSPDGMVLGAAFSWSRFGLLDVKTGEMLVELPCPGRQALSLCFAPDGLTLATVPRGDSVELWFRDGRHLASLPTPDGVASWTVAFSANGAWLAAGLWSGQLAVWDLASRRLKRIFEGHHGAVWNQVFVPGGGDLLASCAADGTVKLWSMAQGRQLASLPTFESDALALAVGPQGRRLVVAGAGEEVQVIDLAFYDQHIAGNLRHQFLRLQPELGLAGLGQPLPTGTPETIVVAGTKP